MEKSDVLYYIAWGSVIIMLGVFALLASLNVFQPIQAFLFWVLTTGIIALLIGFVKTREAPKGSLHLIGFGLLLVILSASIMVVGGFGLPFSAGLAIIVIFAGLGIVGYALLSRKEKSE